MPKAIERTLPPLDEARIHSRYRKLSLDEESQAAVDKAVRESRADPPPEPRRHELTKPGDPEQVRGIPAYMSGYGGTIRGTAPGNDARFVEKAATILEVKTVQLGKARLD